jgi:putative endonuclease
MLRCRDNSIYTGITNNLEKRIGAHTSGNGSKYLRGRLPVELIYKEDFLNRSTASKREIEVKKLKKKEKELLIKSAKQL